MLEKALSLRRVRREPKRGNQLESGGQQLACHQLCPRQAAQVQVTRSDSRQHTAPTEACASWWKGGGQLLPAKCLWDRVPGLCRRCEANSPGACGRAQNGPLENTSLSHMIMEVTVGPAPDRNGSICASAWLGPAVLSDAGRGDWEAGPVVSDVCTIFLRLLVIHILPNRYSGLIPDEGSGPCLSVQMI